MKDWLKKWFVPHEGNDFKPDILQQTAVVGMLVLVLISFSIANLQSIIWISSDWLVSTILPAVVVLETNTARGEEGKVPLSRSELLDEVARLKAEDMASKGYFAHWSPSGESPWYWFGQVGYNYVYAGENIAVHFTDSGAVVDAWLNSTSHRANIMNDNYTEIGIGTAKGTYEGYDTVFVVQMFGTPAVAGVPVVSNPDTSVSSEVTDTFTVADGQAPEVAGASVEDEGTVTTTDAGTMVYETFASTVNPGAEIKAQPPQPVSFFNRLLTSPRLVLQSVYSFIGILIIFALILSIIIEWRRQHPIQIAYSVALVGFMILLFQVHMVMTSGTIIA